jgi:hypothetical protein
LSYLFLRDYENQLEQFGSGYTLHPALPVIVIAEFGRLLDQKQIKVDAGGDWVSSTYAWLILSHEELVAGYPKAEQLASRLRGRHGDATGALPG